jgi:hypothetical protein
MPFASWLGNISLCGERSSAARRLNPWSNLLALRHHGLVCGAQRLGNLRDSFGTVGNAEMLRRGVSATD